MREFGELSRGLWARYVFGFMGGGKLKCVGQMVMVSQDIKCFCIGSSFRILYSNNSFFGRP